MSVGGRLEERLQIAIRPLTKGAVGAYRPSRVEFLAQSNDQSLPLNFGEPPIERDRPLDSDRQSEERSYTGLWTNIQRPSGTLYGVRRNTNFAANILQLGQGHPLVASRLARQRLRPLGGLLEYLRDLVVVVSPISHCSYKVAHADIWRK